MPNASELTLAFGASALSEFAPVTLGNNCNLAISSEESCESSCQSVGGKAKFGPDTDPTHRAQEMRMESLRFEVKTGDITKECADIIIHLTDNLFTREP
ncbi:hypothetical protein XELAEV_180140211mg, partial [Xenopus laevis]